MTSVAKFFGDIFDRFIAEFVTKYNSFRAISFDCVFCKILGRIQENYNHQNYIFYKTSSDTVGLGHHWMEDKKTRPLRAGFDKFTNYILVFLS